MSDDSRLSALVRSAVPPVIAAEPSRDLWPEVTERIEKHEPLAWFDIMLAAGAAAALLIRPELLVLLAYTF
jgi:hypothetical protein